MERNELLVEMLQGQGKGRGQEKTLIFVEQKKHADVLARRFGLRGHEMATLEEVGREIGLTRERVRQIQVEALKRLREILEENGLNAEDLFSL